MPLSHLKHKAIQVFQKAWSNWQFQYFLFMFMSENLFLFQDSKQFIELALYKIF